ncbi:hypothetical protein PPTG_19925 [Phytophthora nicotianae INRA-310]|uniref:Uncharacterized protein n=1 Tax=Phytophthora nicotianae (strain INRA-310) TaxID=761204 RepID=W2PD44_PHYN3|nr:hypothetical protein PPTG_19925 [Phytophthora nicotianae INRA-310]ETM97929.1 hypothetical protein PPTG_19925 [Phytophthora nicotianae INRA-310]
MASSQKNIINMDQVPRYFETEPKSTITTRGSRKTKAENPKVPRYDAVAQWTLEWVASKTAEDVKKAFTLCGLVAKEEFEMDKLHAPLKGILRTDFNINTWHFISDGATRELVRVSAPDW